MQEGKCTVEKTFFRGFSIEKIFQFFASGRMTELSKRLRFNLTDAFTRDVEFFSYFFQCTGTPIYNAESEFKNFLLTGCERVKNFFELFTQQRE